MRRTTSYSSTYTTSRATGSLRNEESRYDRYHELKHQRRQTDPFGRIEHEERIGMRSGRSPQDYRSSRGRSSHDSRSSRGRNDDRHRSRSPHYSRNRVINDDIREGAIFMKFNYYNFINTWVEMFSDECRKSKNFDLAGKKEMVETTTSATSTEKLLLILPGELSERDRDDMLHCDLTILGLPAAIFFGSGYGVTPRKARYAASKDLADKFHRAGIFSDLLHQSIVDRDLLDGESYKKQIKLSVYAAKLLREKMGEAHLTGSVLTQRLLSDEDIAIFKTILRSVVLEVYGFPAKNKPADELQQIQNESQHIELLSTALYQNNQEMMNIGEPSYSYYNAPIMHQEALEMQQLQELRRLENELDNDINRAAMDLEKLMLDFRSRGRIDIVETICASSAFKSMPNITSMRLEEKKQLAIDLEALIKCYSLMMEGNSKDTRGSLNSNGQSDHLESKKNKRLRIGDADFHMASYRELSNLKKGASVLVEDESDGRWKLTKFDQLRDDYVFVTYNEQMWIKIISEVFIEDGENANETPKSKCRFWDSGKYEKISPHERKQKIFEYAKSAEIAINNEKSVSMPRYSSGTIHKDKLEWVSLPKVDFSIFPKMSIREKHDIFEHVALLIEDIAYAFKTKLNAHIFEIGRKTMLITYLENISLLIFSGRGDMRYSRGEPSSDVLFSAYRMSFLPSFKRIIPVPVYRTMISNIDRNIGLEWNRRFFRSYEFQQMANRAILICSNEDYSVLNVEPHQFDVNSKLLDKKRFNVTKDLEEESKAFWTYERIKIFMG